MIYFKYFSDGGVAATGLTLTWESLVTAVGKVAKTGPAFTEIGGGWYSYTITLGSAPWDVTAEDLVGEIDGGAALVDSDRYKPVLITKRELALNSIMSNITDETTLHATSVATALLATTGFTVGGTTSVSTFLKLTASFIAGKVTEKVGGGVLEYRDLDDNSVVFELDWETNDPFRTVVMI